jgi:hypothetical protein
MDRFARRRPNGQHRGVHASSAGVAHRIPSRTAEPSRPHTANRSCREIRTCTAAWPGAVVEAAAHARSLQAPAAAVP